MRFGLVMNGGVSLAVWIGGVTTELDHARLASDADDPATLEGTARTYRDLLGILGVRVVVDVIAGASAGGINGILMGAAIATGKELPNLRETWIRVGDFRNLLRSPSERDPPSVMKGDAVVLAELRERLAELYTFPQESKQDYLYLYVTATDLRGFVREFRDSTGRAFDEYDYRRTLRFVYEREDGAAATPAGLPSRPGTWQDEKPFPRADPIDLRSAGAWQFLAEAARSTSSFPVAFEAYRGFFEEEQGKSQHWLIDGGVLDNQPFNPVLDRIAVLPGGGPVKRVVAYVVPYVNEPGSLAVSTTDPTAKELISASGGLPRELPKLQSLDRVTQQRLDQLRAEEDRKRTWKQGRGPLSNASASLFALYQTTRLAESFVVFGQWASPRFLPGDGVHAQDPAIGTDAPGTVAPPDPSALADPGSLPWIPESRTWPGGDSWKWGLAPAERVASWALLFLRDALIEVGQGSDGPVAARRNAIVQAREAAGRLVRSVRKAKPVLLDVFRAQPGAVASLAEQRAELEKPEESRLDVRPTDWDLRTWAKDAFADSRIAPLLTGLQSDFVELDGLLAALNATRGERQELPRVNDLLDLEVVRNAGAIDSPAVPFPFEFLFMSAGVDNSLGHPARGPQEKLAGIKLNHFAGFLKRSWRANDWLWGRMDGVEHVLRALFDADAIVGVPYDELSGFAGELAGFAFPLPAPGEEKEPPKTRTLARCWRQGASPEVARSEFKAALLDARYYLELANILEDAGPAAEASPAAEKAARESEARVRALRSWGLLRELERCRRALAARCQLDLLEQEDDELARVAQTVGEDSEGGASRISRGVFWADSFDGTVRSAKGSLSPGQRVELWRSLDIGREKPEEETSSRLVMDVGAQAVAVAAGLVAGNRGGLPLPARTALASLRGATLAVGAVVRLLAKTPWIGAAVVAFLTGLLVWGLVDGGAFLGSLAPALAVAVAVGSVVLLTIAVGTFEESLSTVSRVVGFLVLLGVPLAFGLTAGWPGIDVFHDWLSAKANWVVVYVAAVCGYLAAACAVARFTVGATRTRELRPLLLNGLAVLASAVSLVVLTLGTVGGDDWLDDAVGADWAWVLIGCAVGALAATATRFVLLFWPTPVSWRHGTLFAYRVGVVVGLTTLLVGYLVERWLRPGIGNVANAHKGVVLVGLLLVSFVFSAFLVEIVLPWFERLRRGSR